MTNYNQTGKSTIILGDLHGRSIWKKIIALHPYDNIIFLGDYFDSKENIPAFDQINNFNALLEFKRNHPKRVTLLIGNHDFHYMPAAGEVYSGYQKFFHTEIWEALEPAFYDRHLQVCKQVGKYLISHAGLTQTWCLNHHIPFTNPQKKVNDLLFVNPRAFAFSPGPFNEKTGDEPQQGPLWVRPGSLEADAIPGFIQVVGHTQQPGIIFDQHIIYIDVFSFTPKYLQITPDGNALVRGL